MGLAFGTALSVTLSYVLLARSFGRRLGSLHAYAVIPTFLKTVVAAVIMGILIFFLNQYFHKLWKEMDFWQELISLGACVFVGVVSYFGCCRLMRIKEIRFILRWLKDS